MLHGIQRLKFKCAPLDLLKDVAIYGNNVNQKILAYLILELEDNKFMVTSPGTEYYPVYNISGLLDSLIYFNDLKHYLKKGAINTHTDTQLRIIKAYTYNPNCSFENKLKILKTLFKQ